MKKIHNLLFLLSFLVTCSIVTVSAHAGTGNWSWSKEHNNYMPRRHSTPYLEHEKHLQIPQWNHDQWVAEDWISQRANEMDLINGWYRAKILDDQVIEDDRPVMVVGPNFYRLSGYDKRRVAHVVDVVYGITAQKENGFFYLKDWKTDHEIGVFDKFGLRLH